MYWIAIYLKLLPTVILTGKQFVISLRIRLPCNKAFFVLLFQNNHSTITAVSGNS